MLEKRKLGDRVRADASPHAKTRAIHEERRRTQKERQRGRNIVVSFLSRKNKRKKNGKRKAKELFLYKKRKKRVTAVSIHCEREH